MTVEPYASAKRVFWVVDNGSSHRGQASIDRLEGAWPTLRLIHLPVHASWLNQVEIVFSVIQRKVVNPNDFTDLDQITERLAAFERNQSGLPGLVGPSTTFRAISCRTVSWPKETVSHSWKRRTYRCEARTRSCVTLFRY
jgi:DDE superfamily endonuclease